ncbi:MAG TPA: TonB family protein [Vicinamibacterales bacterium]
MILAIAAVVLLAFALPLQFARDRIAKPDSAQPVDVGLPPQPVDAAKPADALKNVASPSTAGVPTRTIVAGARRPGVAAQYGPLRVGGDIKPPKRIFNVNAIYPEEAKAAGIEGAVVMRITIGDDGSVTNVVVLRSIPMLDDAAIESVLQWQYEPTLLNGVPVEVEMIATVTFTLQ